ncbi:zf-HC2 domain-containing protein [candidate division KSB1 bacterium]|nr:zf-HC2 domain-containing protein [candidate division KSB1 bacterium]
MNCKEIKSHISSFIDGQLEHDLEHQTQAHLSECELCRLAFESDSEMKFLFQESVYAHEAPSKLKRKIRKAISKDSRKETFLFGFFNQPRLTVAAVLTVMVSAFLGIQGYKMMTPVNHFDVSYVENLSGHIECIGCYYTQYQNAENFCAKHGHSPAIMAENKEVYSFIPNEKSAELKEEFVDSVIRVSGWVYYQSNFIEIESYEIVESDVASIYPSKFVQN